MRDVDASIADHLVDAAARLIAVHGTAGLTVHAIAQEANVADGVLYNYFANKDELLARGLRAHVESVLATIGTGPVPGSRTVEENLCDFVTDGLRSLGRILPAFAGVIGHAIILSRMGELMQTSDHGGGLPHVLAAYLAAEQRLGRIAADADIAAATTLIIGACHDVALPPLLRGEPVTDVDVPPNFVEGLVRIVLHGIAPPTDS